MPCECSSVEARSEAQRRVVRIALVLNATVCVIGILAGVFGDSLSILADALDMLCDASGYALVLWAIGRSARSKHIAARWTGGTLVLLGLVLVGETVWRWIAGSHPLGPVMMGYSVLSFAVNVYVLGRLASVRREGVHLRASYICTRADVLANIAVFVSGLLVWLSGWQVADLLVGLGIAVLVFREAWEILGETDDEDEQEAGDAA